MLASTMGYPVFPCLQACREERNSCLGHPDLGEKKTLTVYHPDIAVGFCCKELANRWGSGQTRND